MKQILKKTGLKFNFSLLKLYYVFSIIRKLKTGIMNKLTFFIALIVILIATACSKNISVDSGTGILEDGPLSSKLGKRIQLGEYGLSRSYYWGRNANELFITAETKLLRLDLTAQKIKVLESSGGIFTGKTNENSGIIFIGTLNGERGYYEYRFNTDTIAGLVPLSLNSATNFYVGGNTLIFYNGTTISSNPCANLGPWDYCWQPSSGISSSTLYHVDKLTKQFTLLPYKTFKQFSNDGSKSIFMDNFNVPNLPVYVFDNTTKQFTDSFTVSTQYSNAWFITTYYDNEFRSYYTNDNPRNQVIVVNARTNQEIERHTLNVVSVQKQSLNPATGTIVYVGTPAANSNSRILGIYDMRTRQDKTISTLTTEEALLLGDLIPSDDNKKLLIRYLNDLYIKEIN